jgi:hypothetical protein
MPRVAQVGGVALYIYFADHNPPHFHALEAGSEALITIRDCTVLRGSVPSLAAVIAWANAHREILVAAWNRCNPSNPY